MTMVVQLCDILKAIDSHPLKRGWVLWCGLYLNNSSGFMDVFTLRLWCWVDDSGPHACLCQGHYRARKPAFPHQHLLGRHLPCCLLREVAGCEAVRLSLWAGGSCLTSLLGVPCSSPLLTHLSFHCLSHHRFGSVPPGRQHHSPVKNKSARLNVMLAALTPLRLAVTLQAIGAMEVADAHLTYLTVILCRSPGDNSWS